MKSYQERVYDWMLECFGEQIAMNCTTRYMRFGEEALELMQSLGGSKEEALKLVEYVFSRPVGEPNQEVGGVMVTLAALCYANGLDMEACGEVELAKVWQRMPEIRNKQIFKNTALGMPITASATVAARVESGLGDTLDKPPIP